METRQNSQFIFVAQENVTSSRGLLRCNAVGILPHDYTASQTRRPRPESLSL